jgi:hypothetical protein
VRFIIPPLLKTDGFAFRYHNGASRKRKKARHARQVGVLASSFIVSLRMTNGERTASKDGGATKRRDEERLEGKMRRKVAATRERAGEGVNGRGRAKG